MLSDFSVLGIAETDDREAVKAAFRRRVKETHPDLRADEDEGAAIKKHLLFIGINQAYRCLMARLPAEADRAGKAEARKGGAAGREGAIGPLWSARPLSPSPSASTALAPHKDPAYAFYKTGIDYFRRIHPSQWDDDREPMEEAFIPGRSEVSEKARQKIKELARTFPRAYYYFSLVANEYPASIWAADARDKMVMIEERVGRYRKIIESFDADRSWGPWRKKRGGAT